MRQRWVDYIFGMVLSALVVISITAIGWAQANQYRGVVAKLQRSENTIVCILRIEPAQRTNALVQNCIFHAPEPSP